MKTLYLRQKKSGNFEISNEKESTHKFTTKKAFIDWFNGLYKSHYNHRYSQKIIKATYRMSQTYFNSAEEVLRHHLKR